VDRVCKTETELPIALKELAPVAPVNTGPPPTPYDHLPEGSS